MCLSPFKPTAGTGSVERIENGGNMPRVRPLTSAERAAQERDKQIRRTFQIISMACRMSDFQTLSGLASELNIPYTTLHSQLRGGSIRAIDMARIIKTLNMDDQTVLAISGKPEKCRYER